MPLSDYDPLFEQAGKQYNVDPQLLKAVAYTESRGQPNVVSDAGAEGVMQFMPATAKGYGIDPFDPRQAIPAAAKYLSEGIDKYGSPEGALMYYAGGPDEKIWGAKTRGYPALVASNYAKVGAKMNGSASPVDNMSDDALISAFGPAQTAPAQSHPVDALSDDDLLKAFGPSAANTAPKPALASAKSVANSLPQGMTPEQAIANYGDLDSAHQAADRQRAATAGVTQSLEDIPRSLVKVANYVLPKMGLGQPVVLPFEQETENRLAQNQGNPDFDRGRFLGSVVSTAPLAMGAGSLVTNGLNAAGRAVPAIQGATDFLAGQAGGAGIGGSLLQTASRATNGGIQGAAATPVLAASTDAPLGEQLKDNALLGGALGAAAPIVADAAAGMKNKLVGSIDPITARLAQRANDLGITLRGSQISDSPFIKTADSVLATTPMAGIAKNNAEQRNAFTAAVAKTIGAPEGTTAITPEVMQAAKTRIGGVMNDVAARTQINAGNELGDSLNNVLDEAKQVLADSEIKPLQTQVDNILGKVNEQGILPGEAYQALTRKGAPLDRVIASRDPNVSHYASQVRDALDDALEASAAPEDLAALQHARLQYKNMKTIEPLVMTGTPGEISPVALNGRVNASFGNRAYTGAGDLGDLADIGQRFLKEPPNSGTEQRSFVRKVLTNPFALGMEGAATLPLIGAHPVGAALAAGGLGAGLGTSAAVGSALRSNWYRNMLLRGALDNGSGTGLLGYLANPAANRLIPAGLGAGGGIGGVPQQSR